MLYFPNCCPLFRATGNRNQEVKDTFSKLLRMVGTTMQGTLNHYFKNQITKVMSSRFDMPKMIVGPTTYSRGFEAVCKEFKSDIFHNFTALDRQLVQLFPQGFPVTDNQSQVQHPNKTMPSIDVSGMYRNKMPSNSSLTCSNTNEQCM